LMDTITPVESHLTPCRLPHFCPTRGRLALGAEELSSNFRLRFADVLLLPRHLV
jgi:hypothetical protein